MFFNPTGATFIEEHRVISIDNHLVRQNRTLSKMRQDPREENVKYN